MPALKWYAQCAYVRGGRSADGMQVRLEGETGLPFLNCIAKYIAAFAEPPQQGNEEEIRSMTMSELCIDILEFLKESGVKETNGYYIQLNTIQKRGKAAIDNNLHRMLRPEVKEVYSELFEKKVSTRR